MRAVTRYICGMLLMRLALLLVGIVSLLISFELMETADNILAATDGRSYPLLRFVVLRAPDLISQMLPIAALIASILTLGDLLRHRELVAIWNAGVSNFGVIRSLLPVAVLTLVVQFALENWVVPSTIQSLRAWGVVADERKDSGSESPTVWLRSGNDIVALPREAAMRGEVKDVSIFVRDARGALIERLDAPSAQPVAGGWKLDSATRHTVDPPRVTHGEELTWPGQLDLESVSLVALPPRELPLDRIIDLVINDAYGQRPTALYETWMNHRVASAFAPTLMIFLVAALAQRFRRTGTFARLFIFSLVIGFGFLVFDKATLAIGEAGLLPSWLAAWAPSLIFLALIGTILLRDEGQSSEFTAAPGRGLQG